LEPTRAYRTYERVRDPILIEVGRGVGRIGDGRLSDDLDPIEPAVLIRVVEEGEAVSLWTLRATRPLNSLSSLWPLSALWPLWPCRARLALKALLAT
jgi:hypothetical protein